MPKEIKNFMQKVKIKNLQKDAHLVARQPGIFSSSSKRAYTLIWRLERMVEDFSVIVKVEKSARSTEFVC